MRARKLCSKYAELYGPGREHDRGRVARRIRGRDRAQRLGEAGRIVIDAMDARRRRTTCGNMRLEIRRFSITYDTPEGVRRLSSSTRQVPVGSRIRSMPAMWMRTPPGGLMPRSFGGSAAAPSTSSRGNDACREDLLLAVDVVEEHAERAQPLLRARARAAPSRRPRSAAARGRTGRSSRCRASRRRPRTSRPGGAARARRAPARARARRLERAPRSATARRKSGRGVPPGREHLVVGARAARVVGEEAPRGAGCGAASACVCV